MANRQETATNHCWRATPSPLHSPTTPASGIADRIVVSNRFNPSLRSNLLSPFFSPPFNLFIPLFLSLSLSLCSRLPFCPRFFFPSSLFLPLPRSTKCRFAHDGHNFFIPPNLIIRNPLGNPNFDKKSSSSYVTHVA